MPPSVLLTHTAPPLFFTCTLSLSVALLERVLGAGGSDHFTLSINESLSCPDKNNCFTLADGADGKIVVTGSTASELTGGLGVYLREYCGMTIGWVRGGGSNTFIPKTWPSVFGASGTDTNTSTHGSSAGTDASGAARLLVRSRSVPYSHVTQVCTHSYTLVWHDWLQWERFIDWMALAGHNSIVAPTGQEEVQYKVRGVRVCMLINHLGIPNPLFIIGPAAGQEPTRTVHTSLLLLLTGVCNGNFSNDGIMPYRIKGVDRTLWG